VLESGCSLEKDDVEQVMAQDLVGCEVAAEIGGLDIVYGIVTNYIQCWYYQSPYLKQKEDEQESRKHLRALSIFNCAHLSHPKASRKLNVPTLKSCL
jgi:hypothetical protein